MTSHEHDHDHDHTKPPSELELRVKALESLLVERKIVEAAALDAIVDAYENKIGPRNGAAVVARAWVDPEYKAHLLSDSTAAIAELGFSGLQGEDIAVVENTPALHNMMGSENHSCSCA